MKEVTVAQVENGYIITGDDVETKVATDLLEVFETMLWVFETRCRYHYEDEYGRVEIHRERD